jgi:hypothetical protein
LCFHRFPLSCAPPNKFIVINHNNNLAHCCEKSNIQFKRKLDTISRRLEARELTMTTWERERERENDRVAKGNADRDLLVIDAMF